MAGAETVVTAVAAIAIPLPVTGSRIAQALVRIENFGDPALTTCLRSRLRMPRRSKDVGALDDAARLAPCDVRCAGTKLICISKLVLYRRDVAQSTLLAEVGIFRALDQCDALGGRAMPSFRKLIVTS
jgi:hypothetical protein